MYNLALYAECVLSSGMEHETHVKHFRQMARNTLIYFGKCFGKLVSVTTGNLFSSSIIIVSPIICSAPEASTAIFLSSEMCIF